MLDYTDFCSFGVTFKLGKVDFDASKTLLDSRRNSVQARVTSNRRFG